MKTTRLPKNNPDHSGIFSILLLTNRVDAHLDIKIIKIGENRAMPVMVKPSWIDDLRAAAGNIKLELGFKPAKIFPEYQMVKADRRKPNNTNSMFLNTETRVPFFVDILMSERLTNGPSRVMVTRVRNKPPVEKYLDCTRLNAELPNFPI